MFIGALEAYLLTYLLTYNLGSVEIIQRNQTAVSKFITRWSTIIHAPITALHRFNLLWLQSVNVNPISELLDD